MLNKTLEMWLILEIHFSFDKEISLILKMIEWVCISVTLKHLIM